MSGFTWRIALGLIVGMALTRTLSAQKDAPKDVDPDPEKERATFKVADGFEVNLFAADPLLAKPIQINFDAAGRLWVACSEAYPQIKPGQKQNDRIIILEDTDGKGRANKTTVFADGLLIPTGVVPGDGGAYVANSTDLMFLSEPDKNGKATKRTVLLSGFGTEDTHHIIHTFRWGPDGMLYFNQSVYIHSHIETPHGVRRLGGGGIWQFRPETRQLEVFVRGWWNAWGHQFDRWGQSIVTDGAGGEGINYAVPGASYDATPGATRILHGLNPGHPKYCGEEIISGRHFPDEWQGNIIANDFRAHRVCRFVLTEDGSGYESKEMTEVIKSTHPAFRPIDVKMGPDGALYIADWYNPIIQHGEVDFRDPRRDQTHGRIWRVTAKGRPLVKRPDLVGAKTETLLDALKAPEDWTRQQAKRVLKERGEKKVVPLLAEWIKRLDVKDANYEHNLLEGLWTYQSLNVVEPALLAKVLAVKDHHARAAAQRVLAAWHDRLPNALDLMAAGATDDHPQVRLEAVCGLRRIHKTEAVEAALTALDRPVDKFLDYALWQTVRELQKDWLPAFQKGELTFNGDLRHLTFALQAVGSPAAVQPLVDLLQTGKVPKEREESVWALVAGLGGPQEAALVLKKVGQDDTPASRRALLLETLAQTTRLRKVIPAGDLGVVGHLLKSKDDAVRSAAARVAGLWRLEDLRPQLLDYAGGKDTSDIVRRASLEGLVLMGEKATLDSLMKLANKDQPMQVRRPALLALASVDVKIAADRAVELLAETKNDADPTDLFNAFLEQKTGAAALAGSLANYKIPDDIAKIGLRVVRASGRNQSSLEEALTTAGGLTNKSLTLSPEEVKQFLADLARLGDPARGEKVFRRKDQVCLKCHAIGGAGGQVGPDLSSIGGSAQPDYILESILLPNKVIKENYHTVLVTTKKGQTFSGIKVRQSDKELILRNGEDQEISIPVDQIDEQSQGGSLMPAGLADPLTRGELLDLVRFLSELGKVGPFQVGKAQVVRRWQTLEHNEHTVRLFYQGKNLATHVDASEWAIRYATVAGMLPLEEISYFKFGGFGAPPDAGFVRFQVDCTTAGKVKFLVNSADHLKVWLDSNPVAEKKELTVDLAKGLHFISFSVDLSKRKEGIRCELEDVKGSEGKARIIQSR